MNPEDKIIEITYQRDEAIRQWNKQVDSNKKLLAELDSVRDSRHDLSRELVAARTAVKHLNNDVERSLAAVMSQPMQIKSVKLFTISSPKMGEDHCAEVVVELSLQNRVIGFSLDRATNQYRWWIASDPVHELDGSGYLSKDLTTEDILKRGTRPRHLNHEGDPYK